MFTLVMVEGFVMWVMGWLFICQLALLFGLNLVPPDLKVAAEVGLTSLEGFLSNWFISDIASYTKFTQFYCMIKFFFSR